MSAICAHSDRLADPSQYLSTTESGTPQWQYLVWWSGLGNQTTMVVPGNWTGSGSGWNADNTVWSDGDGDQVTLEAGSYASGDPYTAFYFVLSTPALNTTINISDGTTTYYLNLVSYNS